jgi:hypothetical protein
MIHRFAEAIPYLDLFTDTIDRWRVIDLPVGSYSVSPPGYLVVLLASLVDTRL